MKLIRIPEHKKIQKFNGKQLNEAFDFKKSIGDEPIETQAMRDINIDYENTKVPEVEGWLKEYNIQNYNINCTGHGIEVIIDNHLNLANRRLTSFPTFFKIKAVAGNCNLANNRFTSFKNFPEHILGDLICTFNYIQDFSGDLPVVEGKVFAEKQRCHTKYKLSDENYRKAEIGELNENNIVQIISTGEYGVLMGINEYAGTANVLINDEIPYKKDISINDIDVINGITYLEELIEQQNGR